MESVIIPPGLSSQEYADFRARLLSVERALEVKLGADNNFCTRYFEAQIGCCTLVAGSCRKHIPNPPPLPPGLMCAHEYGVRLSQIKTAMEDKRRARIACKRAYEALQNDDPNGECVSGSLNSGGLESGCADPADQVYIVFAHRAALV
jgi:hypothetical protein